MPPSAAPSVLSILTLIEQRYPDVPFLALGQTALWDEPTKAIWRRLLDQFSPKAQLIAGVHDTDYFAKTVAHIGSDRPYVSLTHDDGRTRDLWSAAGEMSCLFGSESVPTRAFLERQGVPFDLLARQYAGGKDAFYADQTTAWGWRGIVSTASHDVIAHDVPLREIAPALLEQIDWAFSTSLASLEDVLSRQKAEQTAATVRQWVTEFLQDCDQDCRLTDLYQTLLPRFYSLLLGEAPRQFDTTASTELFLFNRQTCDRPRFSILRFFLDPQTCVRACDAYNQATDGSGIYPLTHFEPGAIPFDVVLPGRGRGTLRLTRSAVVIDTHPEPISVLGTPSTPAALAALLEEEFGSQVVLVGKAVTLVDMLAAEFLVVFHETASGYTGRTTALNAGLAEAGMQMELYPIVRLQYPTWDALKAVPEETTFRLPSHLALAFGAETISGREFAGRWAGVVEAQKHVLETLRHLHKTRNLMRFLETGDRECWCDRQDRYEAALMILKEGAAKSETLASRMDEHEQELGMWKNERQGLERRKGEDWRAHMLPLREELYESQTRGRDTRALQRSWDRQEAIRATAFDEPLALCQDRIDATRYMLTEFRRQRRLLERSPEAREARAELAALTVEAQMARLALVRDAQLTIDGLEHTNLRPSAWWLPLVDPTGRWLEAMAAGTEARLETLTPDINPT